MALATLDERRIDVRDRLVEAIVERGSSLSDLA
jgi:hypothetical protein